MASEPIWKREGFATRNQYRNAKAREKGFSSYRAERDATARAKGKPRDYARERAAADKTAQSKGFASANQEQGAKRNLAKWGIDFAELQRMRSANKHHWDYVKANQATLAGGKFPVFLHTYEEPTGKTPSQLVGYIVSYYHAIVDPKHNWDSVRDEKGVWEGADVNGVYKPKSDIWWYRHFVLYSDKRSDSYYETRYGKMV